MSVQKAAIALIVLASLAACGKSEEKAVNPFETQKKALDKSRQVSDDVKKAADAQSKQIGEQTGAGDAQDGASKPAQ
jgi:hypothetical protein